MLSELRIRNVAIIESVALTLSTGFNVLTGETGAGKSIIVGALGLLLGEKGGPDVVRTGTDRASVEGVFDCSETPDVIRVLDERGIDVENGLVVLRREIVSAGKGRAWINGSTVSTASLTEVGRLLVNLHGQHDAQTLLSPEAQRTVVDAYAGAQDAAQQVRESFAALAEIRREIDDLTSRREFAAHRAEYLRHTAQEIELAKLVEGEDARLDEEARRLAHVEDLRAHLALMRQALDAGDRAALSQLATVRKALAASARLDPSLSNTQEALEGTLVSLEELARDLRTYETGLDSDPARLADLERRRDVIHRVTKKYGGSVAAALKALQEARTELDVLDTAEVDLTTLRKRAAAAEQTLQYAARELTGLREEGAARLAKSVEGLLPELGMPAGRFSVVLSPRSVIGATGAEDLEFLVALNVGHAARPLARVASGGELSRLMLALKSILARLDSVPTLVFDEVDSGIGGSVALQVGQALRRLSTHHQVLVITHLAQIAARAHTHIVVAKAARGGVTTTDIAVADEAGRVAELSRMLDGDPESEVSRAHARELLAVASAAPAPSLRHSTGTPSDATGRRRRRSA
jgi:DNA repair protein RecN (Recombination protein N)